ncbi:DNA fragmentation factor-related protein 4 isoform X3 [Rhodnius prolixus]|uniref:DNA fragmentation factor-related protein 4 isoform X3 n=1 Tax=Rhodnius prolixus TaxID=13249 RepID=UPI003D18DDF9
MWDCTYSGFKVTDTNRSKLYGVGCRNLQELLSKGCSKLKLDVENVNVYLQDGTVIDNENYFSTIAEQTILILATESEKVVTSADLIYNALKLVNLDVFKAGDAILNFFDEDIKAKVRVLSELAKECDDDLDLTLVSTKKDHPDWFIGVDSNAETKEEFMEKRCQDRIRNFLYKSVSDWRTSEEYKKNDVSRRSLEHIIKKLKQILSKKRFCGTYFVRGQKEALCNARGDFKCSGVWYAVKCTYQGGKGHEINPYRSRDHRIIFSTWNLDHRIERSRTILPTVTKLISVSSDCRINITYLYELLFTTRNLRLVHVVCHDKSSHFSASCDLEEMCLK